MNIQIIKSADGKPEYALVPIDAYELLRQDIEKIIDGGYEEFRVEDYVQNPVALMRIKAHITQQQLAAEMGVTQAYISKIESQHNLSAKTIQKAKLAIKKIK